MSAVRARASPAQSKHSEVAAEASPRPGGAESDWGEPRGGPSRPPSNVLEGAHPVRKRSRERVDQLLAREGLRDDQVDRRSIVRIELVGPPGQQDHRYGPA